MSTAARLPEPYDRSVVHLAFEQDHWGDSLTYTFDGASRPHGVDGASSWVLATCHLVLGYHRRCIAVIDTGTVVVPPADAEALGQAACALARLGAGERVVLAPDEVLVTTSLAAAR
jgi:hypothetical protein